MERTRKARAILIAALASVSVGGALSPAIVGAMRPEAAPESADNLTPAWTPLGVSNQSVTVVLQLSGDPVAVRQGNAGRKLSKAEKDQIKAELKASQDKVRGSIEIRMAVTAHATECDEDRAWRDRARIDTDAGRVRGRVSGEDSADRARGLAECESGAIGRNRGGHRRRVNHKGARARSG